MMKFRWFRVLVQLAIGIAIILWLLRFADVGKVYLTLSSADLLMLAVSAAFFILASLFVALALYVSLKFLDSNVPIGRSIMASFAGQLLSDVTPARSGYFVTPIILNRLCNVSIEKGVVGVLVTGIVNSFIKVILSVLGVVYFIRFLPLPPLFLNALAVGMMFLLVGSLALLIILLEKRALKIKIILERVPLLGIFTQKIIGTLEKIQEEGQKVKKVLHRAALFLLLSVIANAVALYFIHRSLYLSSQDIINFVFIAAIAGSLMYVPATIAGLGVQETGYVLLLTLLGERFEAAVTFALIARLLFTGTDIIGLQPLIKAGFRVREQNKSLIN